MSWAARSPRRARLPADWPHRRLAILKRDGYRCCINGPRCTGTATEVDHIHPGDNHNPTNLQAVCHPCHQAKTQQEAAAARKPPPPLRRKPEAHPGLQRPGEGRPPAPPKDR